jgi:hypothetical protein
MSRRALAPSILALALGACGTPGRNVPVDLPPAPRPTPAAEVAREVGDLLSADREASRRAEQRLMTLEESGRRELLAFAKTIPLERDPRWLNVLDENQGLPALPPEEMLAFLLWKSERPDRFYAMKAQNRLLELARQDPRPLLAALERGDRGAEALAIAFALSGRPEAVPALVARYRASADAKERRALSEALARLAGENRRPRVEGTPQDRARDADAIDTWYRASLGKPP